jgi:phage terminase Nu1 subunit (DNA packaging protein)
MSQIVNKQELARRLGVSAPRVSQLVKRGLPVRSDGRIDLTSALSWISANVDRTNSAGSKLPATPIIPSAPAPPVSSPFAEAGRSVSQTDPARVLLIGRARAALARAKREERAERLAAGELLERREVVEFVASSFSMIRDALLAQPDRLAAQLAAVSDTAEVHRRLKEDVHALLIRLSRAIEASQFRS